MVINERLKWLDQASRYLRVYLTPTSTKSKQELSMLMPIFGSHVRRIGWIRTISGGTPMYLFFPVMLGMHSVLAVIGYQYIIQVLLKTQNLSNDNYILIDRDRIKNLPYFDKFNCIYCGYANGLVMLIHKQLDMAGAKNNKINAFKLLLLSPLILVVLIFLLTFELSYQVIYNILVSRPLDYQRLTISEAHMILVNDGYAAGHSKSVKWYIMAQKNFMLRLMHALEQIESSWCPLRNHNHRHADANPQHREHFFGPDQIDELRETLSSSGSVYKDGGNSNPR